MNESFGLIQPTLIQQIKKILDEYPDDGQILKELIQNAEDAGASEVKFLIDHHSYDSTNLQNPELRKFQGPALYAYNNAKFTEEDWKGLGMLCDSIKVKDPTKVGRFGLGFKSVFHMTDLPSVVSGESLGIIDPHEKCFSNENGRASGMRVKLNNPVTCKDEFAPYKNVFDCTEDVFQNGSYNGTLFRLPFRQQPSKLSDTLYSDDKKMEGLFESFKSDAHLILLFLMNLERIEIYERKTGMQDAAKLFSVAISKDCKASVQEARRSFSSRVDQKTSCDVSETYVVNIETLDCKTRKKRKYSYVVTHFLNRAELSSKMEELVKDESLSYMPRVGAAFPLSSVLDDAREPSGHVFCFLPLPVEAKSLTGLPVHVNGFFALSQNRRYLKWRSADQRGTTDKSLDWNEGLLREVLPKAYADLIVYLICERMPQDVVYSAWPDISAVDVKWEIVLEPLFSLLFTARELLYSEVRGGCWCSLEDVIFDNITKHIDTRDTVIKLLNDVGQKIVTVPRHVRCALKKYYYGSIKDITPSLVRKSLKSDKLHYKGLSRKKKLFLLKYILSDSKFQNLEGLHLLPLSTKEFTKFQSTSCVIYIDSPEHPRSLLPGMDAIFLDSDIDDYIKEQLKIAIQKGSTQLCNFDEKVFEVHLRKALPRDWMSMGGMSTHVTWYPGHGQHPPRSWLNDVWLYLYKHFNGPSGLDAFRDIPLIPLQDTSCTKKKAKTIVKLARIQKPSTLLLSSFNRDQLEKSVIEQASAFGVTVLEKLPDLVIGHRSLLPYYINPPSPKGVLTSLFMVSRNNPQCMSLDLRPMRKLFSQISSSTDAEIRFLKNLKLFDLCQHPALETPPRPVTARDVPQAAPLNDLPPVKCCFEMIDVRDNSSRTLAQLLGIEPMDHAVLVKMMLEDARIGKYSDQEVDKLVRYTMDHFNIFSKQATKEIKQSLARIPFVTSFNNTRKTPRELFDPQDHIVAEMFLYEPEKFPKAGCYYSEPFVLHCLRDLGLKGKKDVGPHDILNSARKIIQISDLERAKKKSTGILRHLEQNQTLLKSIVETMSLLHHLYSIPWIPVVRERPENYPDSLNLDCHVAVACPKDLTSVRYGLLLGSIKPLVDECGAAAISQCFGWNKVPSTRDVIIHLKNVISSYQEEEKNAYVIVIKEIYRYLAGQNVFDVMAVLMDERIHQWIWNGNGFSSTDEIVQHNDWMDLQPYLYPLPREIRDFASLFSKFGMKPEPDCHLYLEVLRRINESHVNCTSKLQEEFRRDLRYCIEILDAVKPKDGETLASEIRAKLLVPVDVEDDTSLELALIDECTYCDREWLQQGHDIDETDEEKIKYVHRNISNATAEVLGVPTLMSRILDADELEMGESFGQSESLLDRLKGLLQGYTDGLSVPKELIQNADDAGATEVRFLYDERTNDNAMTNLIDEGMKECQGPALWSYNDAVFTEEDFRNVVKLNAATKEEDTGKIGRFGLGFNSVYNLTDVPSFVSGNSIVILDPHTEYLGKAIRDKSKPGMRIDSSKKRFDKLHNQFKPYNGIFGCDLSPGNKNKSYDGTLFRFPLRTASQAKKSKIKNLCYDDNQVKDLLRILLHGAESLLLFTQNVLTVRVFHLRDDDPDPSLPVELFSISKSCEDVIHRLQCEISLSNQAQRLDASKQELVKQSSILKASALLLNSLTSSSPEVVLRSSLVLKSCCMLSKRGKDLLHSEDEERNSKAENLWLVNSCMVGGEVATLSRKPKGITPVVGVAAKLERLPCGKVVPSPLLQKLDNEAMLSSRSTPGGNIFCFLPLPIHSGLPVHINGCFAVDDSRRHLRQLTEDDKSDHGAMWNQDLMSQVVVHAFLGLLQDAKTKFTDKEYQFHTLWPTISNLQPQCNYFVKSFYQTLCSHDKDLELFSDGKMWSSIDNIAFLDPSFKYDGEIGDVAFDVFQAVVQKSKLVINMPASVFHTFERCGLMPCLQSSCFGRDRFFREVVFPYIDFIDEQRRNALVLYALDGSSDILQSLVREYRCIPSSPLGKELKYPKELIHPNGSAARLYDPGDRKFPHGAFCTEGRLLKLKTLGMREDDQEWDEILERAQSVQALGSYDQSLRRTKALLEFIDKKLKQNDNVPCWIRSSLQQTCFLPILQRPQSYPFKWKGDEYLQTTFLSPAQLYPKDLKYLVSASAPILDDRDINVNSEVRWFLQITKDVELNQAKIQLQNVIEIKEINGDSVIKEVGKACEKLYEYFQNSPSNRQDEVISFLKPMKFILVYSHFLSASQIAFHGELNFPPYVCQLPSHWAKFHKLFTLLGVRTSFEICDYVVTLRKVKDDYGDKAMDEELTFKVKALLHLLFEAMEQMRVTFEDVLTDHGTIFLPDSDRIMKPSVDVCVKDCIWMPDGAGITYANDGIPSKISIALGVKTRRQETLSRFATGMPFGQKEKLTNRLKRILTGYPCDGSIMKELLQNADDAKASKICFIKDLRYHPTERVFEESWEPLQGPALCVHNDAPFTNRDIEGIQSLGEGSKGDDPNKTGQYGVGFNAVYHLTDAPSFLSKGKEIGEVMCAFDPNLKYVPCATTESPGIKFGTLDTLRKTFTDVWPCYLEHHFPIDNATMFRFPLRNKEMAETSKISSKEVTFEKLSSLVNDFQKELLEALLFVNYVKEISIHEIDKDDGSIRMTYQVKSHISEADEKKRQEFSDYVKSIGNQLQSAERSLSEIPVRKVSYVLHLEDSNGVRQKWLVVQQIGYECNEDICQAEDVVRAFRIGELGLLPRGGVASLINSSNVQPSGKAFCFLPLPFKTKLPVHINGHFALDHEARRNLWRSETSDYRSKWNEILLKQVVAPCYVLMLEEIRGLINLPVTSNQTLLLGSREDIECVLDNYVSLFPSLDLKESYWIFLAKCVYQYLGMKECRLLPVLRHTCQDKSQGEGIIEWLPPTGQGQKKVFFDDMKPYKLDQDQTNQTKPDENIDNNLKTYFALRDTLLAVGFNLLCMPMTHYNFFADSGVSVNLISPKELLAFFHSYGSSCVLQRNIGQLPRPVESTPFKNVKNLLLVFKYCKKEPTFSQDLHGLPLLLTEDNQLRVFDKSNSFYLSGFYDLVPACSHLFVHHQLFNDVFRDQTKEEAIPQVFRLLDIASFATLLPNVLDEMVYKSCDRYVLWDPKEEKGKLLSGRWIWHVWRFFESAITPALTKYDANALRQFCEDTKNMKYHEKRQLEELEEKARAAQKKKLILQFLEPVKHWCLLPVTETHPVQHRNQMHYNPIYLQHIQHKHLLAPLQLAETVLSGATDSLQDTIHRLSLPELNCRIIRGSEYSSSTSSCEIPLKIVSNLDNARSFLTVMLHKLKVDSSSFNGLPSADCLTVLHYLNDHIKDFQSGKDVEDLKSLPLYTTVHGNNISLRNKKAFVLSRRIPNDDMNIWEEKSGIVFLTEYESLKKLHSLLGCDSKDEVDVYCDIIFDVIFDIFQDMSKEARLAHLTFVSTLLCELECPSPTKYYGLNVNEKNVLDAQLNQSKEKLIQALRNLEFDLCQDGSLKPASDFYDPAVDVFRVMLPGECFPAEPFCEVKWLSFLRKVGLIHNVTNDMFLKFAQEVELEGQVNPTQRTQEKSEILVSHLFSMENIATNPLLKSVRDISFIVRQKIAKQLEQLHPPFSSSQYVCFKGSMTDDYHRHTEIVWTSSNILPSYASPRSYPNWSFHVNYRANCRFNQIENYKQEMVTQLGILESPTCDMVVSHCATICDALCRRHDSRPEHSRGCISSCFATRVMTEIYSFLHQNLQDNSHVIQSGLKNIRCILVEDGNLLVRPSQVVAELMSIDEIPPFLYKIPSQLAPYGDLFMSLGATQTATVKQYAMVLNDIHMQCENSKLDPNETTSILKATKGLFETMIKEGNIDDSNLQSLYLPATTRNPEDQDLNSVFVRRSSEIFFNDAPHFKDRLHGFQEHILVKFKECNVNVDNDGCLVTMLPEPLRPIMLTSEVHEALVEENQHVTFSDAAQDLKNCLTSHEFFCGLIRLVKHANYESEIETKDEIVSRVQKSLSCINVYSVKDLRTRLVYQGSAIPESEAEVACFEERKKEGTRDVFNIYVKEEENIKAYLSRVAETVDRITGHLLGNKLVHLSMMLQCSPEEVSSFLDDLKIREDNSYLEAGPSIFPKPGHFIHIEDHYLLENAFTRFAPGEYVGYELDDPSLRGEDGTPTYIYAIIVEQVSPERYKINIGTEHIEVDADKLYKFYRRKQEEETEIEVFTGKESIEVKPENINEAKRQVRETLENAWRLPEERKRRIIRRLYLSWHPDKNPGNEEFCTEVFKFLLAEIERLEKGISADQASWSSSYKTSSYSGFYSGFYNSWTGFAQTHKRYRSHYGSRGGGQPYHHRYPQPGEASRWYRQAKADLEAASKDIQYGRPSYEWACFKCHQSAEKALKAAQYSQDDDHSRTHDLPDIASSLGDSELQSLACSLERLLGTSTRMRYPDRVHSYPKIPHDIYSRNDANEALEIAQQILVIVQNKFLN